MADWYDRIQAILKKQEGFDRKAFWDYKQWTNGHGTRALYPGEVISPDEANNRLRTEATKAYQEVDQFAPHLGEGPKAALTSLTFNSGGKWKSSGLGKAILAGNMEDAKRRFLQYNKAGGQTLPGLVRRRNEEVGLFDDAGGPPAPQVAAADPTPDILKTGIGRQSAPTTLAATKTAPTAAPFATAALMPPKPQMPVPATPSATGTPSSPFAGLGGLLSGLAKPSEGQQGPQIDEQSLAEQEAKDPTLVAQKAMAQAPFAPDVPASVRNRLRRQQYGLS